jgi:DNA-directed RNA polymerase sigma subunit (sigma70/sigma32)
MDPIKEAFLRAKQDIQEVREEMHSLKSEIESLKTLIQQSFSLDRQTNQQTDPLRQTNQHSIPTDNSEIFNKQPQYGLKSPNTVFSTGNGGVPTDRQTNQQTDRQTINTSINEDKYRSDKFENVSELLSSIEDIKEEVRLIFKSLTKQEINVFANIYSLEEQGLIVDYSLLAQKLGLSESSIRDYTLRIIKKGIPLIKTKEKNKRIILKISIDLKRIASLKTVQSLLQNMP